MKKFVELLEWPGGPKETNTDRVLVNVDQIVMIRRAEHDTCYIHTVGGSVRVDHPYDILYKMFEDIEKERDGD